VSAALICGQTHSPCQIIADEKAGQKEEEKGKYIFLVLSALMSIETDLRDFLGLKLR
jgi:hypothetical protein